MLGDSIFIDVNIWSSSLFSWNNQEVEYFGWFMESEGERQKRKEGKKKYKVSSVNDRTGSRLTSLCLTFTKSNQRHVSKLIKSRVMKEVFSQLFST